MVVMDPEGIQDMLGVVTTSRLAQQIPRRVPFQLPQRVQNLQLIT